MKKSESELESQSVEERLGMIKEKIRIIQELRKLIGQDKLPAGTWNIISDIFD